MKKSAYSFKTFSSEKRFTMSLFSEELLHDMPTLANPSSDEDEESEDDDDFIEKFRVKSKFIYY